MSQAKVDAYKANKKNRKKIAAKENRSRRIWTIVIVAVLVAVVLFIVFAILNKII